MRKRFAIGLLAAIIVVGLVVAKRDELLPFAIERGVGLATGYGLRIAGLQIEPGRTRLTNVRLERAGQPVLEAREIVIDYAPRDLLPGSSHRFGLLAVAITGAKLTLTRFRDGSFNLNIPAAAGGPPQVPRVNPVPLRCLVRVRDTQLELREPYAYDQSAKIVRVRDFNADAVIDTAAVTKYRAAGAFGRKRDDPFTIAGRIDAIRGYALHHAHAPRFPLRALANYFADTPVVRILKGAARNFDARLYAFDVQPNVAPEYHVSLRLDVDGARLALSSLAEPIEDIRGRLEVIDNAFFISHADAMLAGMPLHITGGAYDFDGSLTGHAQLRLGVWGAGDLAQLRRAFPFTRDQPISGKASMGVLVAGRIDDPVIVADARSPLARYRDMPFDRLRAGVVYHANVVALAPLQASYSGMDLAIRGTLNIGTPLQSRFAVHTVGPASRLPYLDEMLGNEPIAVDAAATGSDLLFHVVGSAASLRGVDRVAALVEMNPNGTAAIEPFWLRTERGDLEGAYLLDRPHSTSAFWLSARNMRLRAPRSGTFPGLALPQMPPIDGHVLDMTTAGGGAGTNVVLAGKMDGADTTISGVKFDRLGASFAGTLANAAINPLVASGPWGRFTGAGGFSSQRFVSYGRYAGTFEGLQPFLGPAITGHGRIGGAVGVAIVPQRIIVQGSNLAMRGATLHGVPIDRASLTLAIEGNRLRIYSARAHAAGGDVVAAGTFSLAAHSGNARGNDALSLIANRLNAAQLRGIGLPLEAGTLSATGNLAAGAPIPSFDGGVTIGGGRIANFSLSGGGDMHLSGDAVSLRRVVGALGGTYALVNGSIGSLTSGLPAYALDAGVPAARISTALHDFGFPNYATEGTFNAKLRIGGRSVAPSVSGHVGVPAGEVNGLPFVDGSAELAADTRGVDVRQGAVSVGTTAARFTAVARPGENAVAVSAPRADLSDFNNFFDTGDTLDGNGRVKFAAAARGSHITTNGDIDVSAFRYRNLPIGDTRGVWSSANDVIAGALAIGGDEGRLNARGSIGLTPGPRWQHTLARSRFDLGAEVNDLDLSLWLPALGMQNVPITGRASGETSLHGRFPQIAVRGSASITGGTLGPLTLDSAAVTLHSAHERLIIDRAEMTTPELTATAAGSLGLEPNAPLDVQVHAATDDLAQLVYNFSRTKVPVSGSFESGLKIGGTYIAPTFLAGFDATDVHAYGIPIVSLFGELHLHGSTLVLSDAGATFQRGQATLAGSLPLQLAPLRLAAPGSPISFDLDVVDLDPAILNDLLGNNTKLGGSINGHIGLSGTVAEPVVLGHASLAAGSYVSDLQRVPMTHINAGLAFNHGSASLEHASAQLGSGMAQATGSVSFPGGLGAGAISFAFKGKAQGAQLDLPAFGSGTIDARLALAKQPKSKALLSGDVTLTNASLPFASFVKAAQGSNSLSGPPLPLAFDLQATAGKNVRIRGSGYGAGLDIGATGSAKLGGTLSAPTLEGGFDSTGGTLTYFDRAFRVQQGSVRFNAADGVLPTLSAVATSNVVNPDPDRGRNPYGLADVTIKVDGPIQSLRIGLTSNPTGYSQDQILGLIAPFGGFIGGIGYSAQSELARQQPNGITPLGAVSPIPNVSLQQRSTISVGQEAFNILNAQFTAGLLAPVENSLGQGLGLSSVNLTLGYYGNFGVSATRLLGRSVSAVYAVTFGIPQIQSFGLQVQATPLTTATLNFFYQSGPTKLIQQPSSPVGYSVGYLLGQPLIGNSGFSLTVQHNLW